MALKSKIGLMAASMALLSVGLGANVFAVEFDGSGLSEDGAFHVNMAPPENEVEQYVLNEEIASLTRGGWGITSMGEWNCKDNFTKCKLVHYGTEWTDEYYEIKYIYDAKADELIDKLMDDLEFPEKGFFVSDLDFLKYLVQVGMAENTPLLPTFSSEMRTFIDNRNLEFSIDVRMGGYDPLLDFQGGMAKVYYNGTLYNTYDGNVMVYAPHIFYVESDAEDYVDALKKRITEAFGDEVASMIEIDDEVTQTVREFYAAECGSDPYCEKPEEYFDSYEYVKEYLDNRVYGICPQIEVDGTKMGICYDMIIVADSSKVTDPSYVNSTDVLTDINITTKATDLPGDALTYAEDLGSDDKGMIEDFGDKFYAYEIGLRSASFNGEISESEDGFTVSIPVPEILKGMKAISAYWKNFETGELEEHRGKIVGDMVVFETTHFSTYVLAESTESEESDDDVVVPGAPDTGMQANGLTHAVTGLPIFGAIMVVTGAMAFVVTKRK